MRNDIANVKGYSPHSLVFPHGGPLQSSFLLILPSQSGHRVASIPVILKRDSCQVSEGAGAGSFAPTSMRQASRHSLRRLLLRNPK